jgi:hypothetical protein
MSEERKGMATFSLAQATTRMARVTKSRRIRCAGVDVSDAVEASGEEANPTESAEPQSEQVSTTSWNSMG